MKVVMIEGPLAQMVRREAQKTIGLKALELYDKVLKGEKPTGTDPAPVG